MLCKAKHIWKASQKQPSFHNRVLKKDLLGAVGREKTEPFAVHRDELITKRESDQ